jgi:hypothetical protein
LRYNSSNWQRYTLMAEDAAESAGAKAPAITISTTHMSKMIRSLPLTGSGSTLYDIGCTSDHAWFITSGIVSLLTTTEADDFFEAPESEANVWALNPPTRHGLVLLLSQIKCNILLCGKPNRDMRYEGN